MVVARAIAGTGARSTTGAGPAEPGPGRSDTLTADHPGPFVEAPLPTGEIVRIGVGLAEGQLRLGVLGSVPAISGHGMSMPGGCNT